MDEVNIEKNEKKDALLIAIEEGRTIVKDPNALNDIPVWKLKMRHWKCNIFDRKREPAEYTSVDSFLQI